MGTTTTYYCDWCHKTVMLLYTEPTTGAEVCSAHFDAARDAVYQVRAKAMRGVTA